jgi:hypothetical protein
LKLNPKLVALVAILLIVTVGAVVVFQPFLGQNTTLNVSQIYVDPQGSAVGDEWRGSYWNILTYINANDDLAGVVLPEDQKTSITFNGAVQQLESGAKVEVKIDPQTPYLIRDIQENTKPVAPPAKSNEGGQTVTGLDLRYYGWAEPTWRIYTPFVVSIYKDGSLVGSKTLNMQGQSQVQTISTSEGEVRIENLGVLGGQYLSPNTPSQISIFKGAPNVYDWAQIQNMVVYTSGSTDTYAKYWYGMALQNGYAVSPVIILQMQATTIYNGFPGWLGSGGNPSPVRPVLFTNDKTSLPVEKRSFSCLTEWLQSKGVANLAGSLFNTRATGDSGALWQSASFVTDTNGQTALKLEIPWGAFGTPLVNIRVPTELADTWIERPIVTQTSVSAVWMSTNTKYGDLQGSLRIAVTLTNKGSVTGGTLLEVQSGNSKLSITPLSMTVNNLAPNVPQTVYFDCTNLGVEDQIDDIPVTIIAKDTYTGGETGRDTIYGTLLPTLTSGTTTLNIRAVEKGTDNPIVGLQLRVVLPSMEPKTVFTGVGGETGPVTLSTPQGGAYIGSVVIQSEDTFDYKAAYLTYNVASASSYSVTLEVERKDTDYPTTGLDLWVWLAIGAVISVVILVAAYLVVKKKGKRRRR